jgi:predicted MFS family arabinose efflux permease
MPAPDIPNRHAAVADAAHNAAGPSDLAAAIAILLVSIVGNLVMALFPLFISGMSEYLGYGDGYLGELAGVSSAGAALFTVAAFFFLDRKGWPLRLTALLGLLVFGVANLCIPLAFGEARFVTLLFFVAGCASGLVWAAGATAVTTLRKSSRLISIFYGTPYFTALAIQPLMPALYENWGVGSAFQLVALSCLLGIAALKWFPPRALGARPPSVEDDSGSRQRLLAWLLMMPVAIALLLQYVANSGLWVYFGRIGLLAGHSPQESANVLAVGAGMALIGTALATALTPRVGARGAIVAIVAISLMMTTATLGMLGAENYMLFAGSVFVFNAMITFVTPFYFLLLLRLSVSPGKSALLGNLCMMAGFAAGPYLIGRMADGGDFALATYATSAMFVVSALIVIASAAQGKARDRRVPAS